MEVGGLAWCQLKQLVVEGVEGVGGLGLVTAKTACCNSLAHCHRSVPGSAGGRLGVA